MTKKQVIAAFRKLPVSDQEDVLRIVTRLHDKAVTRKMAAAAEDMIDYYQNDPEVRAWLELDIDKWPLEYPEGALPED